MRPLRIPLGLLLAAYGGLVLVGVMPHDSATAGLASLLVGLTLLSPGLRKAPDAAAPAKALERGRRLAVATLGLALAGGILVYNAVRGSGLSAPEWAILAYGVALVVASPRLASRLGPTTVGAVVGWSFPLVLAPFCLYALNAALSSGLGDSAASPVVQLVVVQPAAAVLRLTGLPVAVDGAMMLVPTERGSLSLGVGLVCAGLYPLVLFAGIVACHAWMDKVPVRRTAGLLAAGVAGLWALNLLRLAIVTRVGVAWGPEALEATHANLGWIMFGLYMAAFWPLAMRRKGATEGTVAGKGKGPPPASKAA